jgi:NADH:ubiquinone oxidoreductase subunit 6 (subunit J)
MMSREKMSSVFFQSAWQNIHMPQKPSWFVRHRNRICAIFGLLLIGLAICIPIIVPRSERKDLLIVTIFFGLVGALMIFTALMPDRANNSATNIKNPLTRSTITNKNAWSQKKSASRSALGIGLGAVFLVAGLFAPYVLPNVTPDERFLMMIGFAPVAAVGGLLMWIFLRGADSVRLPKRTTKTTPAPSTQRSPVTRAPESEPYQKFIPLAVVMLIALLVITVIVVVVATFIPFANLF